jgi:ATP-binding cassette subfamily C protein
MEKFKFLKTFSLLNSAFSGYKPQILLMTALSFASGILEGVGINALVPLLSFVEKNHAAAADNVSLAIEKFFNYFHLSFDIKSLLIFIILLFLAKSIILFASQYITAKVMVDFENKTREGLLKLTFPAKWPFLSTQKVGHLDQMLTTDVPHSSAILFRISDTILEIVNLLVYGLIVINISFSIMVFAAVIGIAVFVIFRIIFSKTRLVSGQIVQENKNLAHYANENIIGMKVIKSMHIGDAVLRRGVGIFENMKNLNLRLAFLKNITMGMLQLVGVFSVLGLFAFLYKTTAFSLASFAVVVYALNKIFNNIQLAQINLQIVGIETPYLVSIMNYKKLAAENKEQDNGEAPFVFNNQLVFKDVNFDYGADQPTLSKISFSIKKGEILGLIGPSGAGKTTIADLLLRFLELKEGAILLDGKNISEISLQQWKNNVGYVAQEVFLLNDTIQNNIKFYDNSISDDDVVAAAKMANIYDFIQSQPEKFLAQVGERGLALSGGQRQRIALARVLARRPKILILDEATSLLDNESEFLIQKSIEGLRGNVTVVIIAHRLSTVMIADKLICLDKGRVVEEGCPRELLNDKNSYFFKTYNNVRQA